MKYCRKQFILGHNKTNDSVIQMFSYHHPMHIVISNSTNMYSYLWHQADQLLQAFQINLESHYCPKNKQTNIRILISAWQNLLHVYASFLTFGPTVPGNPIIPDSPFCPEKPGSPVSPERPGSPGSPLLRSGKPGAPGRPGRPGAPGWPLSPVNPEKDQSL